MMSRFTQKAQDALSRAQQIMFAKQHTQLDVEHIFLALLQQRNSLPAQIITRLGGDVQDIRRKLESALNNMQSFTSTRGTATGYITLRANRVLLGATEEADRLNDEYISTEHLLLAIAGERGGATSRLLLESDIDQEKIYAVLQELRSSPDWQDDQAQDSDRGPRQQGGHPLFSRDRSSRIVNPPLLVKPSGYSHGVLASGGPTLYLGGQIAMDAEGKLVGEGDVVEQYRQTLRNLGLVVEAAGGWMADIVKLTIYVRDRADYKAHLRELGAVHREFFGAYYPATALVEISNFFEDGVLVEIEGIAVIGSSRRADIG
jgi:enamine deaminase RidA (YjgF/YER057c/UK114 family)